jgi:exopolyphosphatase/guanosine-5'-triphosphate,3'-diphosphate pyrophosphatase
MRVAAVDVGSNSVKLLIADVSETRLTEVERWGEITRVSRGLAAGGAPDQAAIAATREVLARCAERARELDADRLVAAATGGLRLIPDRDTVADAIGAGITPLPVLSTAVEGYLSLLGLRAGADWPVELVAFDLGGASTELSVVERGSVESWSLDLGAVTLTERFLRDDPPRPDELAELDRHVQGTLDGMPVPPEASTLLERAVVGVGGTLTALAFITLGTAPTHGSDVHGICLDRGRISDVTRHLASLTSVERQTSLGIGPGRADILVAGARLLLGILDRLAVSRVQVSAWGLRHGMALACGLAGDARHDERLARRLALLEPRG